MQVTYMGYYMRATCDLKKVSFIYPVSDFRTFSCLSAFLETWIWTLSKSVMRQVRFNSDWNER